MPGTRPGMTEFVVPSLTVEQNHRIAGWLRIITHS
jgi:hypothetical protein